MRQLKLFAPNPIPPGHLTRKQIAAGKRGVKKAREAIEATKDSKVIERLEQEQKERRYGKRE